MINKGTKLNGRYIVDDMIGEGGGGIVYKAFDSNLQNYVVVKQMKEHAASFLERRTEVDILKGVKHECLPKVLDFFEDGQKVYTVMDYIEGISLSEALKQEGRFLQKQVLAWAVSLAHALACLHSQKPPIIHSDIKPANIMWDKDSDRICLIDFNISLAFNRGRKDVTWLSGGYSPPEQYRTLDNYCNYLEKNLGRTVRKQENKQESAGSSGLEVNSRPTQIFDRRAMADMNRIVNSSINEQSDIYSLGATMYHLLTGLNPGINFLEIIPVSGYDIDLSEGFCHIIEKCMEIDPARRYQNGMELCKALEHIYELDSEYQAFRKKRFWDKAVCTVMVAGGMILMAGGVFVSRREQAVTYQDYVSRASQLLEHFEYDEAAALAVLAQDIDESRVEADELELLILYRQGEYEICIQRGLNMLEQKHYILRDEKDQTRMGNLYYLIGSAYLEQGNNPEAVVYFKEAVKYVTENALFYRDYAIALARSQRIEEAETVLLQARQSKLDQDSINFVEGEICYAKKDYHSAQSMLSDVISQTMDVELKERAVLLLNRMYLQCGSQYLDTAIAMLEQELAGWNHGTALNLSEALAGDYLQRAEQNNDSNDRIQALNIYIMLYNSGYQTIRIMDNIGILYRDLGRCEEASQMAEQMLELYPQDYHGHKLLAFLELDKQQQLPNGRRNYKNFQICYQNAQKLYQHLDSQTDSEMQFLLKMYEELQKGGWY